MELHILKNFKRTLKTNRVKFYLFCFKWKRNSKMNCWAKTVRLPFIPFCYIIRETQAGLLTHYKKAFVKTTQFVMV